MAIPLMMPLAVALAVVSLNYVITFLFKLYKVRSRMLELRRQGLPMPPYSPVFGHLLFCNKIISKLPKDAHPQYLPDQIRRALPELGPVYYIDTWPFGPVMLVVSTPSTLYQMTQEYSLPKYHALKSFLQPIAEGLDIVSMEGELWKTWRGIFNPGFSVNHLMSLISSLVEETKWFCENLKTLSEGQKIFRMKNLTDNLTMDIIGRVVLETELKSQRQSNPLVDGLRMQVKWLTFGADVNPFVRYNPIRPLVHWYNLRRMNKYVSREIDSRLAKHQSDQTFKGNKSVVDLVLSAYFSVNSERVSQGMDSTFKKFTMNQVKLFLFSGHDTTSSTVCYIFYILATNPSVLSQVRAEHDSILGPDASKTASLITTDPFLLNQLPYTLAVIKETLRKYPAVSSTRAGEPNFNITDDLGRRFPTDGFLVWANSQAIHRDPAYWRSPDKFIPERWLVGPGDPLHPVKGAWRPFEHGPRNCIGQELAILEIKVIMVMTVRTFGVKLAYEEVDLAEGNNGISSVYGERGYQIQRAQPSLDLPCQVIDLVAKKTDQATS